MTSAPGGSSAQDPRPRRPLPDLDRPVALSLIALLRYFPDEDDPLGTTLRPRTGSEAARFFDGLDPVEPDLVTAPRWRPGAAVPETRDATDSFHVGSPSSAGRASRSDQAGLRRSGRGARA
ncbi:SAM-dependent methyltransferase [Streptomyces sp. NPDC002666]